MLAYAVIQVSLVIIDFLYRITHSMRFHETIGWSLLKALGVIYLWHTSWYGILTFTIFVICFISAQNRRRR